MLYHEAAQLYTFGSVLPLDPGKKSPPPKGYTGEHGKDAGPEELSAWAHHAGNYALRLPDGVVGIDVDQYGSKTGLDTLKAWEDQLGPLPPTPMSTGRAPGTGSGIRFYRYPGGKLAPVLGEAVEIVQRGHRYAVVWPSKATGSDGVALTYAWHKPMGAAWLRMDKPPALDELAELPPAWVEHLRAGASASRGPAAAPDVSNRLLVDLVTDERPPCGTMNTALAGALAKLSAAGEGGRHDATTAGVLLIVATAAEGHSGFSAAIEDLEAAWDEAIGHDPARAGEFARMVSTAVGKAASEHPDGQTKLVMHLCDRPAETPMEAHVPPELAEGAHTPELPQLAAVFDPLGAHTDLELAQAVAVFMHPTHRWANDVRGWVVRDDNAHVWRLSNANPTEGAKAMVTRVAQLAPVGDPGAPAGTPEKTRADRRKRLQSNAGNSAIAAMLVAYVAGQPWTWANLDTLDLDPNMLWAGGVAWDLEASRTRLVPRDIDPNTPHLATAAVYPADVPTPMWDRFMAAAFPDDEQRAWVMRLFGVATTGHADAALPILYGAPGTGKTTAVKLVAQALGGYATNPSALILDAGSNTAEEYGLLGKRLAFVDEGPRNGKPALEKLKALTGGGRMQARPLYKNNVEWQPTHTLFMSSNDYPQVADGGLRRRVRAVESAGDPVAVRDAVLPIVTNAKAWAAELPGVLHRLILEAAGYLADRTTADNPLSVHAAMEALAREQDPILSWFDERVREGGPTKTLDLYDDFKAYAERIGTHRGTIPNQHVWGRRITNMGYTVMHTRAGNVRALEIVHGGGFAMGPGAVPGAAEEVPEEGSQGSHGPANGGSRKVHTKGSQAPKGSHFPENGIEHSQGQKPDGEPFSAEREPFVNLSSAKGSQANTQANPLSNDGVNLVNLSNPSLSEEEEEDVVLERARMCRGFEGKRFTGKPTVTAAEPDAAAEDEGGMPLPALLQRGLEPVPVSLEDASALLATLAGQSVGLDVETSAFPVGHHDYKLKTAQLGTAAFAIVLDPAMPEQLAVTVATLDAAAEIVAHSATADVSLVALEAGVDSGPWWDKTTDTAVLGALADPALTGAHDKPKALALKALSARMLPAPVAPQADKARAALFRANKWLTNPEPTTPPERNGWHQVPIGEPVMVTYAASDVLDTAELRDMLPDPTPELMTRERALQRITARLPERGLKLDAERVVALTATHERARDAAAAKLAAHGIDNPGSNDQVGAAMLALGADLPATATGKPSTAADVVERLAEREGPAQDLAVDLLEFREHEKLLSTYLTPFGLQCTHGDGRARPTILTLGAAATGRMSSVRPNIQQVPRDGGLRGLFVADEGQRFIAADFSSVEVRIAAAITGDETLARMVREGTDLHGEVVKLAWGMSPDDPAFKGARYAAKRAVFGYLYGAGLPTMARQLGAHGDKAQAVVDALKAITPGLVEFDKGLRDAVRNGQLTRWVHPSGRAAFFNKKLPHKALNMIVQGYGRELLVDAMFRWEAMHPGHTIIPIHDEMVIQVDAEHADQYAEDLVACMTTTLEPSIPIVAEADAPTTRWGSVES
jgi:P4 family phage/plasmid primase-like protien